ncbi:MAG: T9SS type A sorting domain-containing protein [Bacteroidetes bacterium]|nr:T9SS type A sorting domain-containing protein [Bacteroidota bacterium]
MRPFLLFLLTSCMLFAQLVQTAHPIMFVTQTPASGFASVTQTFNNHLPSVNSAPRGGDLMIRYTDGTVRNLTREAGYGDSTVLQGAKSIAVRQPSVHWSGTKALFSMVIGSPTKRWETPTFYWQIYEVTGFGKGQTVQITKVQHQPAAYNNISPIYGSDDNIIFTSDMPHNKKRYLYPQLDEYENATVVTGLWKLDRSTGAVTLIEHSPSGAFYPSIDSYGRIIFTRWDHLQRDQQADLDRAGQPYGTFNYASEDSAAPPLNSREEVFPEPRSVLNPDYDSTMALHTFNHFFPWEINQDGTEEETVNHVGRHEFGGSYSDRSFLKDNNLSYITPKESIIKNRKYLVSDAGMFHITEDPNIPGTYYTSYAREFSRETAGQLLKFTGGKGMNPEEMEIFELTHSATAGSAEDGTTPNPNHSGHYKQLVPMTDGMFIVSHTENNFQNKNEGTDKNPKVRYNFRLKTLTQTTIGGKALYVAHQKLTSGFVRTLEYYNGNDYIVSRTDTLWEIDPVEVRSRPVPPYKTETPLADPELKVFTEENVDQQQFRDWLRQQNLALIVSRNVTTRDRTDIAQPYNLKVPGGVSSVPLAGKVYDVSYLQLFQADLRRAQGGAGGHTTPKPGRRVLATPMHDGIGKNPPLAAAPAGSVKLGLDGSMASLVPAHRAMTWQLSDSTGKGVVRERYWITFQPGEIRACASCHGVNAKDQSGLPKPVNKPEALRTLLKHWKNTVLSVRNSGVRPEEYRLEQNYPNPFNPSTRIAFTVPAAGNVSIRVYDALGRQVTELLNEVKGPGSHEVEWDARGLASGIYYYTMRSGPFSRTMKLLLLR